MAVPEQKARIGELLIQAELITPEQLTKALQIQKDEGGKTVEILIAMEYLDTHDFVNFLSRMPGVASINLLNYSIPKEVIALVPEAFALKHEVVPIDKMGKDLTIGMVCPLDSKTIASLEEQTGLRVRPLLVAANDIHVALNRYYAPKEEKSNTFSLPDAQSSRGAPVQATKPELESLASTLTLESIANQIRKIKTFPHTCPK